MSLGTVACEPEDKPGNKPDGQEQIDPKPDEGKPDEGSGEQEKPQLPIKNLILPESLMAGETNEIAGLGFRKGMSVTLTGADNVAHKFELTLTTKGASFDIPNNFKLGNYKLELNKDTDSWVLSESIAVAKVKELNTISKVYTCQYDYGNIPADVLSYYQSILGTTNKIQTLKAIKEQFPNQNNATLESFSFTKDEQKTITAIKRSIIIEGQMRELEYFLEPNSVENTLTYAMASSVAPEAFRTTSVTWNLDAKGKITKSKHEYYNSSLNLKECNYDWITDDKGRYIALKKPKLNTPDYEFTYSNLTGENILPGYQMTSMNKNEFLIKLDYTAKSNVFPENLNPEHPDVAAIIIAYNDQDPEEPFFEDFTFAAMLNLVKSSSLPTSILIGSGETDSTGQLIYQTVPLSYQFDGEGNILSVSYTYTGTNAAKLPGTFTYTIKFS